MPATCAVDGCGKTGPVVRGMCNAHYLKQRKYGDPHHVARPPAPPGMKKCCACRETLTVVAFNAHAASKDGLYAACRECTNARKRAQYRADPETVLARNHASRARLGEAALLKSREAWAKRDPAGRSEAFRKRHLWRKFGMTVEGYQQRHAEQGGLCAACGLPETDVDPRGGRIRYLAVDHCHETGQIRGLLCRRCNTALGLLGDTPEGVERLLDYLK